MTEAGRYLYKKSRVWSGSKPGGCFGADYEGR